MIEHEHPAGFDLGLEILSTLGAKPAPVRLLAEDFHVSVQRVRQELIGISGLVFERYGMCHAVRVAPLAAEDINARCTEYWQRVYAA